MAIFSLPLLFWRAIPSLYLIKLCRPCQSSDADYFRGRFHRPVTEGLYPYYGNLSDLFISNNTGIEIIMIHEGEVLATSQHETLVNQQRSLLFISHLPSPVISTI